VENIFDGLAASLFRVEPEDEGSSFFQNIDILGQT
jgi:hypothetical protein